MCYENIVWIANLNIFNKKQNRWRMEVNVWIRTKGEKGELMEHRNQELGVEKQKLVRSLLWIPTVLESSRQCRIPGPSHISLIRI